MIQGADWSARYRVIVAPSFYMMDEATATKLRDFVSQGGTLVWTPFSGIVDENDHIVSQSAHDPQGTGYPALLRDVLGIWVEEWDVLPKGHSVPLIPYKSCVNDWNLSNDWDIRLKCADSENNAACQAERWMEITHLTTAEPIASLDDEDFSHSPAITINK